MIPAQPQNTEEIAGRRVNRWHLLRLHCGCAVGDMGLGVRNRRIVCFKMGLVFINSSSLLDVPVLNGTFLLLEPNYQIESDQTEIDHKRNRLEFQVVDGGDLNINFMVLFGAEILLQETKKTDGGHKFPLTNSGDYQLCFDNSFSYQTRKVLFFELYLLDESGSFDETNMFEGFGPMKQEYSGLGFEVQKFQRASNNIKNLLNRIEYHQSLLRAYEARDRAVMNANLERVTLWSVINSVVLIIVGLLQWLTEVLARTSEKLEGYAMIMVVYHLICLLLPAYLVVADEYAYTVIVRAGKTDCYGFTITDEKYRSFEVDYQVIEGGELDITFYVTSPKGLRLVNDFKHNDGLHKIDISMAGAGYGDYTVCFDNTFSIQSDKRVFFELFLLDAKGHFLGGFDQKINVAAEILRTLDARLDHFQNVTVNVKNNLNIIERLQRQYASTELADRAAIERSYEMINFWSVLHLFVMLFAVSVQVYMVRSLFEENSRIGRILRKGRLND
uniref:GOLD domain-containing protein n=1 Tax=Setaria digitata TaxID=48799 RepID=A0A915PWK8_9BILA